MKLRVFLKLLFKFSHANKAAFYIPNNSKLKIGVVFHGNPLAGGGFHDGLSSTLLVTNLDKYFDFAFYTPELENAKSAKGAGLQTKLLKFGRLHKLGYQARKKNSLFSLLKFFKGLHPLDEQFEKDGVGSQQVSFFNNEGALLCEGVANFQKLNKGSFDLSCFNGTLSSNGVASLEKVGSRMVHSVGSGLFSNGDKFVFVTGLRGSYIRELYPEYFADLPHF